MGGERATFGFGAILVQWLSKRVLRKAPAAPPLHIPGAPKAADPAPSPWGPSGVFSAVVGAATGAVFAWGWYGPEAAMYRLGVIFAFVGVVHAVWQGLRLVRDAPAVGEAPPDDPDKTVAARMPGVLGGIALACFGALIALL